MSAPDHDQSQDAAAAAPGTAAAPAPRRPIGGFLSELWHQKPGPRVPRPTGAPARTDKQVVDGLDRLEQRLAIAATAFQAVLTPVFYWYFSTHGSANVRKAAFEFLITGIITTVALAAGTFFKRRALVGFAAFMTGMSWLTYGSLYFAVLFLFFGGWLIMRVMRKQKQDREAGRTPAGRGSRTADATRPAPTASKRYTPPQRATTKGRAASKGRTGATSRSAGTRKATQGRR